MLTYHYRHEDSQKLQSELKVISPDLYFHIYSKNVENSFILEISKKF